MMSHSYKAPEFFHENEAGVRFYQFYCEGCGAPAPNYWPEAALSNFRPGGPLFFSDKKDKCGCTKRLELTTYHDNCLACGGPIYLTPGRAMYKASCEVQGQPYEPLKYCSKCGDEVVISIPCRNAGCQSVRSDGLNEITRGEEDFYKTKNLSLPNNCAICRRVKKYFLSKREVRPKCQTCEKYFRVSGQRMIMILKNEEKFEIPVECPRCSNLTPEEKRKAKLLKLLGVERKKLMKDALRLLRDKSLLAQERQKLEAEKKQQVAEKKQAMLAKCQRISGFEKSSHITNKGVIDAIKDVPISRKMTKWLGICNIQYVSRFLAGPPRGYTNKVRQGLVIEIPCSSRHTSAKEVMKDVYYQIGKTFFQNPHAFGIRDEWREKLKNAPREHLNYFQKQACEKRNTDEYFAECLSLYCAAHAFPPIFANEIQAFNQKFPEEARFFNSMNHSIF